jgi:peptidyl-prolyl cis-trans isomerase D
MQVPLTHDEVVKWHHDHLDRYSAAELVTARHILIRSSGENASARARAEDLLRRAKAGEDFATLARTYSEDPATRDAGGDLGTFGRGTMLDAFEKAVFALQPGDLCDHVVHTDVGYHVIECTDHVAAYVHPLPLIYSNVSADAARAKGEAIARHRADSLYAAVRTSAAMRAAGRRLGLTLLPLAFQMGGDVTVGAQRPFFERLANMKPGEGFTPPTYVKGEGYWIAWVDSIGAPQAPTWEQARARVLAEYRHDAGHRALEAKCAEIDSMAAAGWSFDSLAALWGGPSQAVEVTPGRGLSGLGASAELDSMLFGAAHGEPLPLHRPSGWIRLPSGRARLRVDERVMPGADVLATRSESMRDAELERRLREYFDQLKLRYPVKILDPKLRDMQLADLPPGLSR